MPYDAAAYKGLLVQGRLREALDYLSGFPEQAALLRRTEGCAVAGICLYPAGWRQGQECQGKAGH